MTATVRRAGKQWRDGAPPYVVDCFYDPRYTDCYTVFVIHDDGTLAYLASSPSLGFSGWNDIRRHEAAAFRYRSGRYRIRWRDVPEAIRAAVVHDMTVAP